MNILEVFIIAITKMSNIFYNVHVQAFCFVSKNATPVGHLQITSTEYIIMGIL